MQLYVDDEKDKMIMNFENKIIDERLLYVLNDMKSYFRDKIKDCQFAKNNVNTLVDFLKKNLCKSSKE